METDNSNTAVDGGKPIVERNKTLVTISKIFMFIWGVGIGVIILNPFGFELTFYHFVGFALGTFFIIIFYNGMNAKKKPETVKVSNFVNIK